VTPLLNLNANSITSPHGSAATGWTRIYNEMLLMSDEPNNIDSLITTYKNLVSGKMPHGI
jgi:hypothetical protein